VRFFYFATKEYYSCSECYIFHIYTWPVYLLKEIDRHGLEISSGRTLSKESWLLWLGKISSLLPINDADSPKLDWTWLTLINIFVFLNALVLAWGFGMCSFSKFQVRYLIFLDINLCEHFVFLLRARTHEEQGSHIRYHVWLSIWLGIKSKISVIYEGFLIIFPNSLAWLTLHKVFLIMLPHQISWCESILYLWWILSLRMYI